MCRRVAIKRRATRLPNDIDELANNAWADLDTDCSHAPGTLDAEAVIERLKVFARQVIDSVDASRD